MTRHVVALAGVLALFSGPRAFAQTEAPTPAHLSVVEGHAVIERGTTAEAAAANLVLVTGDRLRTDQGRVELLLGDGTAIHVDERSALDLNSERVLRLLEGRIIVLADGVDAGIVQVDTAPASIRLLSAGEYRLSLFGDGRTTGIDVAVVRGEAEVDAGGQPTRVLAGAMVSVREGEAPTWPVAFNTARVDAFVEWSEALTSGRRATRSAEYLPQELHVYAGDLDRHGRWGYEAPYGYVWYPSVAGTWRPYHRGRWRWTIGFGWTWVGGDPWAWPTHHYGRWGLTAAGLWYWIPARAWAPAWVHWAVSPSYVGWCALGWNNRPVLGFWGHHRSARLRRHVGPWHGWSLVSTRHFRHGAWVHRSPVARTAFAGANAPRFVVQAAPPNVAVPRGALGVTTRTAGVTSVSPRAGRSRRGPELGSVAVSRGAAASATRSATAGSRTASGTRSRDSLSVVGRGSDGAVRRGSAASPGIVRDVTPGRRGVTERPPAASSGPAAVRRAPQAPATRATGGRSDAPSVIYHRGSRRSATTSPAAAGRAGSAIPRGRPATPATGGRDDAAGPSRGSNRGAAAPAPSRRGVVTRPPSTPGRSAAPARSGRGLAAPSRGGRSVAPSGGGRSAAPASRSAPRAQPRSSSGGGLRSPGLSAPARRSAPAMRSPAARPGSAAPAGRTPSIGRPSAPSRRGSSASPAPRARQAPAGRSSSGTAVPRGRRGGNN